VPRRLPWFLRRVVAEVATARLQGPMEACRMGFLNSPTCLTSPSLTLCSKREGGPPVWKKWRTKVRRLLSSFSHPRVWMTSGPHVRCNSSRAVRSPVTGVKLLGMW
jgi:hypothetical protein